MAIYALTLFRYLYKWILWNIVLELVTKMLRENTKQ